MKTTKLLTIAAIVALVAIPATALANTPWKGYGTSEPDAWDDSSFMQSDTWHAGQGAKIYFNVFGASTAPSLAPEGYNLNVGALDTHFEQVGPAQYEHGILGVWTDCNGDGYIGMAETAAREYDARLLGVGTNENHCPPAPVGPDGSCWTTHAAGTPCPNWPATGYNNYRGVVTELIPIVGPHALEVRQDARTIKDASAAMWADLGRPNDDGGAATCPTNPPPRGTIQSTGGALTYLSCRTELIHDINFVGDTGGVSQLQFSDESNGRSAPIGQVDTLGQRWDDPNRNNDPNSMTVVKAQDCDQDYLITWAAVPVVGPTLESQMTQTVRTQDQGVRPPALGDTNPNDIISGKTSVAGTANYTAESLPLPDRQVQSGVGATSTSNCNFQDDRGDEPYNFVEGDNPAVSGTQKASSTLNFEPRQASRGGTGAVLVASGSTGASEDLGVLVLDDANPTSPPFGTHWLATSLLLKTPTVVENRGGLSPDHAPDAGLASAFNLTAYARVGTASTSVASTPGGAGTYGSAQCGSFTSGIHHGWDCDASHWNLNTDGSAVPSNGNILSYPGLSYQFRDQDCDDGSIGGSGVGVGAAFFGPRPCSALNS